ncbi:metal ABC transporter ATP-binding protein [Bacillus swezeyi]|uniref:metal ABC transporter ATP-binding protein n=1 Tax=Bacillus swezeyi TaxID=1925020 RepID=UPI001681A3DD|nr:metal ABC transporter ATP-binding protein [Bacillus swezeyi]
MQLISLQNVMYGYEHTPLLENVTFTIHSGEFVGITGPNGASKSTLLRLMLRLLKPWHGNVNISKTNPSGERLKIGYLPQQMASFNTGFPSTVLELVRSGRYKKGSWFKKLKEQDHKKIEEALKMVGMWEFRHRKIGYLSGGQKQKVCIARILASEPDILVLDEPTTGMDVESRRSFYQMMDKQVQQHHQTVIMITHDHDEAEPYLTKNIRLERGENSRWTCFIWNSCKEPSTQDA